MFSSLIYVLLFPDLRISQMLLPNLPSFASRVMGITRFALYMFIGFASCFVWVCETEKQLCVRSQIVFIFLTLYPIMRFKNAQLCQFIWCNFTTD